MRRTSLKRIAIFLGVAIWYFGTSLAFLNQLIINFEFQVDKSEVSYFHNGENIIQTKFQNDFKKRADLAVKQAYFFIGTSEARSVIYAKIFVTKKSRLSFFTKGEIESAKKIIEEAIQREAREIGLKPVSIVENGYSYYFDRPFFGLLKICIYSVFFSFLMAMILLRKIFKF